jgi:hypothetical protein
MIFPDLPTTVDLQWQYPVSPTAYRRIKRTLPEIYQLKKMSLPNIFFDKTFFIVIVSEIFFIFVKNFFQDLVKKR